MEFFKGLALAMITVVAWLALMFAGAFIGTYIAVRTYAVPVEKPGTVAVDEALHCSYRGCTETSKTTTLAYVTEFSCNGNVSRDFLYCKKHLAMFYPKWKDLSDWDLSMNVLPTTINEEYCK